MTSVFYLLVEPLKRTGESNYRFIAVETKSVLFFKLKSSLTLLS